MGLQEKIWVKKWQDEEVPSLKKHFKERCGGELEIEVDWASLVADPTAAQNFVGRALAPIRSVIHTLTRESVGKEALNTGFKKLVIRNTTNAAEKSISFKEGVLSIMEVCGDAGGSAGRFGEGDIRRAIEQAL